MVLYGVRKKKKKKILLLYCKLPFLFTQRAIRSFFMLSDPRSPPPPPPKILYLLSNIEEIRKHSKYRKQNPHILCSFAWYVWLNNNMSPIFLCFFPLLRCFFGAFSLFFRKPSDCFVTVFFLHVCISLSPFLELKKKQKLLGE